MAARSCDTEAGDTELDWRRHRAVPLGAPIRLNGPAARNQAIWAGVWLVGLGQQTAGVLPMSLSASHESIRANFPNLMGKRILVVDDEPVVSVDYWYQLLEVGATAAGFLPSNRAAMSFSKRIRSTPSS